MTQLSRLRIKTFHPNRERNLHHFTAKEHKGVTYRRKEVPIQEDDQIQKNQKIIFQRRLRWPHRRRNPKPNFLTERKFQQAKVKVTQNYGESQTRQTHRDNPRPHIDTQKWNHIILPHQLQLHYIKLHLQWSTGASEQTHSIQSEAQNQNKPQKPQKTKRQEGHQQNKKHQQHQKFPQKKSFFRRQRKQKIFSKKQKNLHKEEQKWKIRIL